MIVKRSFLASVIMALSGYTYGIILMKRTILDLIFKCVPDAHKYMKSFS